jgi:hypothetical protein
MMVVLLIAGIGVLLVGLLSVGFGIPVKEFSFGNTLILTGTIAACSGMILLGLWMVVRELRTIAGRLGFGIPGTALQPAAAGATPRQPLENEGFLFGRDEPTLENPGLQPPAPASASSPAPWQDEAAARDRGRVDAPSVPEPVPAAPAVKPRRNLLFSTSSRKERERAEARAIDPSALEADPAAAAAPPVPEPNEAPPATFDDAWPLSERAKAAAAVPPPMRSSRAPSTFTEANPDATGADPYPPAPRKADAPPVTVLKSGVVDGMAYSLYSDGSIEAQMPEGMMRFASIDELRSHLDQRP